MKRQKKYQEAWHKIYEISRSGYKHLKENRFKEAEGEFREILEVDKKNIYALVGMGDVYKNRKIYQYAIKYYEKALLIDPVNKFAFIGLADSYRGLKNFNKAIDVWETYLSYNENEYDIAVLTRLGDTYRKIGKIEKAEKVYENALYNDSENPYALSGLGHLYFGKKDYNKSLIYWNKLLKIEKDDIKVLTNIGNCYRKLKQYNDALKYFYKAFNIEENNFYALYGIADCYRGLRDYSKASEYWNKILKIDPENKKILTRLGDSYRMLGNLENARYYYKKAIEKDFDYYAILGIVKVEKMENNYQSAIENLNQLKNISGLNLQITILLSECYIETGNNEMGIKILSDALRKGIDNIEIKNRLRLLKH